MTIPRGPFPSVHVEKVLGKYDFEPDEFSIQDNTEAREPGRLSVAMAAGTGAVVTKDASWDFVDIDLNKTKPPVYMVELVDSNSKG